MIFNRMRIYTVHIKPDESGMRFRPVFIKEGFNFWAFLFAMFWALYHRLWMPALALLAMNIALFALVKTYILTHFTFFVLHVAVHIVTGYLGNDWLRARLRRRGYILSDITVADSYLRAQQRYLERYVVGII